MLKFFSSFPELSSGNIYFKRHPDGRPSGEVRTEAFGYFSTGYVRWQAAPMRSLFQPAHRHHRFSAFPPVALAIHPANVSIITLTYIPVGIADW